MKLFRFSKGGIVAVLAGVVGLGIAVAYPVSATARTAQAAVGVAGTLGDVSELPALLPAADAERYRAIFTLQKEGKFAEAGAEIAKLGDRLLLGHVLAQRYLHPDYRSTYKEVYDWLAVHADHAEAKRIHALALKLRTKKDKAPRSPVVSEPRLGTSHGDPTLADRRHVSPRHRSGEGAKQLAQVERQVTQAVKSSRLDVAEATVVKAEAQRQLDRAEADELRNKVARAHFLKGNANKALALAAPAAERSRDEVPVADWTAGLAAWRLGQIDKAARHFEIVAKSSSANPWNLSAGAYWAARAHLVARRPERVVAFMQMAAAEPRTFYGLLANRFLGNESPFDWRDPPLTVEDVTLLRQNPTALRVLALIEVEQIDIAKAEVAVLISRDGATLGPAAVALAARLNLAGTQMLLSRKIIDRDSPYYLSAIYPLPHWTPDDGYQVDKAFVFAIMRHESGFNANARSRAGATGLMQLMPRTASLVAEDRSLHGKNKHKLLAPEYNIDLGQKYIRSLSGEAGIGDNLLWVIAAYNAGPGNVKTWLRQMPQRDPLLAIESIPLRETRLFVQRVAATYWIYRDRLGQDAPSLDDLVQNRWPSFAEVTPRRTAASDVR